MRSSRLFFTNPTSGCWLVHCYWVVPHGGCRRWTSNEDQYINYGIWMKRLTKVGIQPALLLTFHIIIHSYILTHGRVYVFFLIDIILSYRKFNHLWVRHYHVISGRHFFRPKKSFLVFTCVFFLSIVMTR